jgi:hypothetical protein
MWKLDFRGRRQLAEHQENIAALESTAKRQKSDIDALQIEWENTLDKFKIVMARLNARIRKSEAPTAPESDEPEPTNSQPPPTSGYHDQMQLMRGKRRGLLSG